MDTNTNQEISKELTSNLFSDNLTKLNDINNSLYKSNDNNSYTLNSIEQPSQTNSNTSFFSNLNISNLIIIIIAFVFILAFIGFNIFNFLGKSINDIIDFFKPYTKNLGGVFKSEVNEIGKTTTKGMETTTNIISGTVVGATTGAVTGFNLSKENENELHKPAISNDIHKSIQNNKQQTYNYVADDSYSSIQMSKPNAKSGFCYIGEEKGIRSCVEIGVNDVCMSGEIFPTKDVCINPNLRV